MSECVYCRQGSIAIGVDGPVCPDCWEEGYGHSPRTADLRTPIKAMTDEELCKRLRNLTGGFVDAFRAHAAADRIEALTAKNEMLGREVNIARYGQPDFAWSVHVQVMDDLNAKLAKAVELLIVCRDMFDEVAHPSDPLSKMLNDTLADIKGEKT